MLAVAHTKDPALQWIEADLTDLTAMVDAEFDLALLAGNVMIFLDPGTEAAALHELLDFITAELPRWRDRADRQHETGETILTSQLCAHLNSAARHSAGWDMLQFRVEETDEQNRRSRRALEALPARFEGVLRDWRLVNNEGRRSSAFYSILDHEWPAVADNLSARIHQAARDEP